MEIDIPHIFQIDDEAVKDSLSKQDNFKIVYSDSPEANKNLCIVYFSSNEIYYPNSGKSFCESILKKDKYEWKNNMLPAGFKHIFVRDIRKQWYIGGINDQFDNPELLADKLRELTRGYTTYTVGSSAGGFAALLFGSILGVHKVYAFNAQMDLHVVMQDSDELTDPLLFRNRSEPSLAKYYSVSPFLRNGVKYFYFQSAKSQMDLSQYAACTKKNLLTTIRFRTSNHGFPFLRHDLKYVFQMSDERLRELSGKTIHPFVFSVQIHGLVRAMVLTIQAVRKRIQKKIKERRNA